MWQKCQFPNFEIQNFTIIPCQNWHERSQFNLLDFMRSKLNFELFLSILASVFRLFCWQSNFSDVKLAINQYSCLKWSLFGWNTVLSCCASKTLNIGNHNNILKTKLVYFFTRIALWYKTDSINNFAGFAGVKFPPFNLTG